MTGQRTHSSESRERVLNAAYKLFVQAGFADVSMQQIAVEASITKATLYHHFRDKQELYIETMRVAFEHNQRSLVDRLENHPDLHTTICEVLRFVLSGERADVQRLMSDFRQHINEDTQRLSWTDFPKPWYLLEPMVKAAIERGEITVKDSTFVARYIYGAMAGFSHIMRMEHETDDVDDALLRMFADSVLYGVSQK